MIGTAFFVGHLAHWVPYFRGTLLQTLYTLDRVSVPSPIAFDILMDTMARDRASSHVLVFCINFERHICTHITTIIKCYLVCICAVHLYFMLIKVACTFFNQFSKCKQTFNITYLSF